ncbi:hypothetical protein TNCV_1822441 [Trichonephila clavipes]|nr:hypothetical protein TNCV_1822441 [Trichonephila clavipes]
MYVAFETPGSSSGVYLLLGLRTLIDASKEFSSGSHGVVSQTDDAKDMRHVDEEAARGLLVTDLVILYHGQVTRMTPELPPSSPNYPITPTVGCLSSRQI